MDPKLLDKEHTYVNQEASMVAALYTAQHVHSQERGRGSL